MKAIADNGISWFEIGTDDVPAAERFYGELFGWTFADDPESPVPYRLISTPEDAIGGRREARCWCPPRPPRTGWCSHIWLT